MRSDFSRRDLLGPGLLLAALALLLWRCTLTFCWSDEGFYLALAHRFWLGDLPFVDEWNTAQLYAPFLLPFYALWRAITGGTTGIYLAARVAAVLLSTGPCARWRQPHRRSKKAAARCRRTGSTG